MKSALFKFLLASILLVLIITLFAKSSEAKNSQEIKVTAYVLEHLTYFRDEQGLTISTNLSANFVVLSSSGDLKFTIFGPAEKKLPQLSSFILVAEF